MLPPHILNSLKDALAAIYWYKNDLRRFIEATGITKELWIGLSWDGYKIRIAGELVDLISNDGHTVSRDMTKLLDSVLAMSSFTHLEKLENGRRLAEDARSKVERLRFDVEAYRQVVNTKRATEQEEIRNAVAKSMNRARLSERLMGLREQFLSLHSELEVTLRGYKLEELVYDLLSLHDLEPRPPYRNRGEQIDGSFFLDGTHFLLECKWHKGPVDLDDLDFFENKVRRKLDNTLGLFLSVNGFTRRAVSTPSAGRPTLILADGVDLLAVLEERIDLADLLRRKKRRASEGGTIYFRVSEMLG